MGPSIVNNTGEESEPEAVYDVYLPAHVGRGVGVVVDRVGPLKQHGQGYGGTGQGEGHGGTGQGEGHGGP